MLRVERLDARAWPLVGGVVFTVAGEQQLWRELRVKMDMRDDVRVEGVRGAVVSSGALGPRAIEWLVGRNERLRLRSEELSRGLGRRPFFVTLEAGRSISTNSNFRVVQHRLTSRPSDPRVLMPMSGMSSSSTRS